MNNNKLSDLEKRTIILTTIFSLGNGLASLFLNVYLYTYTGSLVLMSIYTIIRIGLFPFFFIWGSKITKRHEFVLTYTIGLMLMTCCLLYALLGTRLFEMNGYYVLIAAAITGIGEGFYWFSANTINIVVSSLESRAHFLSISGITNNISTLLAPIIASQIIKISGNDILGNRRILYVAVVLYISVIFIASGLKKKSEDRDVSLLSVLSLKDKKWRDHILAVFAHGMKESLTLTLTGILVYNAAGSGGVYSKLQILFAFITIVSFRLLTKAFNKEKINKTFLIGVFINVSSTLVLVFVPNIYGAIFFGVTNALSTVFYANSYNYLSANIIASYKEEMTARVVVRETYLSIARCTGMALIVFLYYLLKNDYYLQISVVILSIMPFFVYKLLIKYK